MPFRPDGTWKPNSKKQETFVSLPTTIFEGAYLGGAGSGKSELLLVYPLLRRWHENPKFKQLFLRRTFPELEREIVGRSKQLYRPFGAKYNKSDKVWNFPSGAQVYLGHCENEDDVHKYDSMEINLFTPDEITSFTYYIYMYIAFTRVRSSDPTLPAIVRLAGMPGGVGHGWTKKRFIDPAPEGGKIIKGRGGNKRIFIHATQADNPDIDATYKQKLEGLDEAEKQAKLYGSFDAYLGQVFTEFRDKKYPDEPDNALHVIEPIEIPAWWPRIAVGDWGYRAMLWIGFGAISPDARLYVYQELAWREKKIAEWGPVFKDYVDFENPRIIKFCRSIGQERGSAQTLQQQLEDVIGRPVELVTNSPGSRVSSKQLLHEYLRFNPKRIAPAVKAKYSHEQALWILRNRSDAEYQSYIDSFKEPEPEINLPKLQIFDTCPELVQSIKACSYAKNKEGKVAEDVAEFDGDDPYEGIRNMIVEVDRYVNESQRQFDKVKEQDALSQKLSRDNDWTAYYRNMKSLETSGRTKPIRRYH